MGGFVEHMDEELERLNAMSAAARGRGVCRMPDVQRQKIRADGALAPTENAFCPTGPGGGVDASCSPGEGGGGGHAPGSPEHAAETLHRILKDDEKLLSMSFAEIDKTVDEMIGKMTVPKLKQVFGAMGKVYPSYLKGKDAVIKDMARKLKDQKEMIERLR